MNTESDKTYTASRDAAAPSWVPERGFQLRKAGVQFDALRVDGEAGRALADGLAQLTGGDPGPVVEEGNGRRSMYFLVPPGSTAYRAWPSGVTRLVGAPGRIAYIPVPALNGCTWPLSWRHRPRGDDLVHPLLLRSALLTLGAAAADL